MRLAANPWACSNGRRTGENVRLVSGIVDTQPPRRFNGVQRTLSDAVPALGSAACARVGPLAQLAEHRTFNPQVVGSNPTGPTNYSSRPAQQDETRKL